MMQQFTEIAAPYEIGSETAQMPMTTRAGPIAISRYHTNIRKVARHLMRTDGIMQSAFSKLGEAVVGTGPRPRTKFRELLPLWKEFIKSCDPTGRHSFGSLLTAVYVDSKVAGDAFIRMRPRLDEGGVIPLRLQALESEFLPTEKTEQVADGNRILTGIEINEEDTPVAYWLYATYVPAPSFGAEQTDAVEGSPAEGRFLGVIPSPAAVVSGHDWQFRLVGICRLFVDEDQDPIATGIGKQPKIQQTQIGEPMNLYQDFDLSEFDGDTTAIIDN